MATPYLPGHSGSLTYYNPFPTDPARAREHWLNYLSNATLAKYTADSIGRFIERSSREQLAALDEVNGTLQQGFAGVQGGFLAVADGVRGLTAEQARGNHLLALANAQLDGLNTGVEQANRTLSTIDSRLVLLVEQQHLSNVLQENMAELLRVPDEEKKRHADIKWGLKFCKDALRDPDLYHDGLKYLLQAERALPEDYFVLRQIGMLYLYAPPLLDLAQAREYLVKAAKYAAVDSHPDAERISHVLAKSLLLPFSQQAEPDAKAISRFAAETYRHAAQAHYNLGTFADALRLIGKAISLDPDDDELNFCKAKYLAAAGLSSEVLVVLRMLPETNNYVQKVLGDYDLANCGGPQWVTRVLAHRAIISCLRVRTARLAEEWLRWTGAALRRSGMSEENVTRLLTQGGTVVAWGANNAGQINVPAGLSGVTAIAAGGAHTVALKTDGTVVAWGDNRFGQTTVPAGLSGVTAIAAGDFHTLALKTDGTVVAWGAGGEGQSGHPHYGQTTVPAGLSGVTAIAAGGYHTVALKTDGTVVAWGYNDYGQTTVPAGFSGVVAIAAGGQHTLALKSDGTVVAWGNNFYGQTTVPAGLSGVTAIAAGGQHTLALKSDGTVVAWGGRYGQTTVPAGLSGVTAIAAGGSSRTVALKTDGTSVAWGRNDFGQTNVPAGLSGVVAIAAGDSHTVALVIKD